MSIIRWFISLFKTTPDHLSQNWLNSNVYKEGKGHD